MIFSETEAGRLLAYFEGKKRLAGALGKKHKLKEKLIVSLTSHAKRFKYLHLTIASLVEQRVSPDLIVLWLSKEDFGCLSREVLQMRSDGFEIRICEDMRSYKKIIPALSAFQHANIVIADDDIYYPFDWLESLVDVNAQDANSVRCTMALRYHWWPHDFVAPYHEWTYDVQDGICRKPSRDLVAVGVGGVLYPPGSLHDEAVSISTFEKLCFDADDLWLFAMRQLRGTPILKVGPRFRRVEWPDTQKYALWRINTPARNDEVVNNLIKRYGAKELFMV